MQGQDHHSPPFRIDLIPGFCVHVCGEQQEFGTASAKLVALLALQRQPMDRTIAAATLWPHVRDERANANLRTALWRVGQVSEEVIVSRGSRLSLGPGADVDHRRYEDLARRVLGRDDLASIIDRSGAGGAATTPGSTAHQTGSSGGLRIGVQGLIHNLAAELLTHWYEDWLNLYQERWRQLRLHALDSLSMQLTEAGLLAAAVDAATAAVAAEPLRESGYRSLIMAHLSEGNISEAVRTHEQYRALLERELGIAPSPRMYELLRQATGSASPSGGLERSRRPNRPLPATGRSATDLRSAPESIGRSGPSSAEG